MSGLRPDESGLPRPFIVGVIAERTTAAAARVRGLAARDGADAFELNLPPLHGATAADLASLFAGSKGPMYTTCRRRAFMAVYGIEPNDLPDWSDEERMQRQLTLIASGSVAIDMELDTFDPNPAPPLGSEAAEHFAATAGEPAELSWSNSAISRQRDITAAAHALGADVLMSCHTGRPQPVDGLLAIAATAIDRGADLLKIVSPCRDRRDLAALFEATARLSATTDLPFAIIGAGPAGKVSRLIGGHVGSSWLIGRPSGVVHGFPGQPSIEQLGAVRRLTETDVEAAT